MIALAKPSLPVQHEVTGKVTDPEGVPLPGATLIEKGTSNGTVTDVDGNFSIVLDNENATLVVSFIGFATQEIEVAGRSASSDWLWHYY